MVGQESRVGIDLTSSTVSGVPPRRHWARRRIRSSKNAGRLVTLGIGSRNADSVESSASNSHSSPTLSEAAASRGAAPPALDSGAAGTCAHRAGARSCGPHFWTHTAREIGPANGFLVPFIGHDHGDAGAGRDAHRDCQRKARSADRLPGSFAVRRRCRQIAAGQHDGKFLAAIAGDQPDVAHRLLSGPGHSFKRVIARLVPVRIVELLEVIDIEQHYGGWRAAA